MDRGTDGFAIAYTALANLALWSTVKTKCYTYCVRSEAQSE